MNIRLVVVSVAAFLGLGMSMPSCPGQQELKDQVDALTQSNNELKQKVAALEQQVTPLTTEMAQVKQLLQPIADTVRSQKDAMDLLNKNMQEIQAKAVAPKGRAAAQAGKKRR